MTYLERYRCKDYYKLPKSSVVWWSFIYLLQLAKCETKPAIHSSFSGFLDSALNWSHWAAVPECQTKFCQNLSTPHILHFSQKINRTVPIVTVPGKVHTVVCRTPPVEEAAHRKQELWESSPCDTCSYTPCTGLRTCGFRVLEHFYVMTELAQQTDRKG